MQEINSKLINEILSEVPQVINCEAKDSLMLSTTLLHILKEVRQEMTLNGNAFGSSEKDLLVFNVAERLGFTLSLQEKDEILAYLEKDARSFGILQDLVDDCSINDIIVSAWNKIHVQIGRRNFKTSLSFAGHSDYQVFVEKLLTRSGTSYSTKLPIADGMIDGFARIHAVHPSLCETGPFLTVRLNRFNEVELEQLENYNLAPRQLLEYLAGIVRIGQTIMIAGEVGTGKTTLARALGAVIPSEDAVLVIEDTPELKLQHPHVRYLRTRVANTEGEGRVAPAECIRAGMRMAMNRIIFGEIRDAEAAEAFIDVCASGHPGISTIHARSAQDAISRLELFLGRVQKGAATSILTQQIGNAVQVIVHINVCPHSGVRRIMEVREVGAFADNVLRQKTIFSYQYKKMEAAWIVNNRVSNFKAELESLTPAINLSTLAAELRLRGQGNIKTSEVYV